MKQAHKDSKTGERFISPSHKGYRLDYRHEGRTYYIGSFDTLAGAVDCREAIREELEHAANPGKVLIELTGRD